MAPTDSGDTGNPFQSLLGDLMNMLGTNAPDQWEMTRAFALNVATGGTPEANVDPVQRIQVEQLSRVAELNVIQATGMPVTPDGRRLTCVPVGRADWTLRALESWRPLLAAMAAPGQPPPEASEKDSPVLRRRRYRPRLVPTPQRVSPGCSGRWATAIGADVLRAPGRPRWFSGHLAQRTLGQYPLALPWAPTDELLLVTANIAEFATDWSLPEEEALLWVCARELATHSVLSRPSVRSRFEELLLAMAESSAAAQQSLAGRLRGLVDHGPTLDESALGWHGPRESPAGDVRRPRGAAR